MRERKYKPSDVSLTLPSPIDPPRRFAPTVKVNGHFPVLQPSSPSPSPTTTAGGRATGGAGVKRHLLKNPKPPGSSSSSSSSSSTVSSAGSSSSNAGLGLGGAADGGVGANYGPVVSANLQVLRKILEQQRSNAAAAAAAESASRKVG